MKIVRSFYCVLVFMFKNCLVEEMLHVYYAPIKKKPKLLKTKTQKIMFYMNTKVIMLLCY